MFILTGEEILKKCDELNKELWEIGLMYELSLGNKTEEVIYNELDYVIDVMESSSKKGREKKVISLSGLIGGDSKKIEDYLNNDKMVTDYFIVKAMARAISCSEVNSAMGKIVAMPTAGACGIIPAAILSVAEKFNFDREKIRRALLTASIVGILFIENATISGAEGGCQAECGTASAMAAAAVVYMMGGTPKQSFDAAAICIKNVLGLICDPVLGLVEVPCAKRNASGVVNALSVSDLVLAGVESKILFDDCVKALDEVGRSLPKEFRETALGGLAKTKSADILRECIKKL
ncbi:MAG TPA: L-serine ammonia-lyase, iron-sulfur-dependent, subunit alpha [Candidatus Dwaynia gallinarum]|nr:L-serine ammonia-lyase, iron-sulfur-dependent, subunit alpha [Candidatus Dwaynia gallinarum]